MAVHRVALCSSAAADSPHTCGVEARKEPLPPEDGVVCFHLQEMEKLIGFPYCPLPLINSKDGEANHGAHLLALAAPRSPFLLLVVAITTPHATLLSSTTILKRLEDFKLNCTGWFYGHCFSTPRYLNPGCISPLTTLLLYCVLSQGYSWFLLLLFCRCRT